MKTLSVVSVVFSLLGANMAIAGEYWGHHGVVTGSQSNESANSSFGYGYGSWSNAAASSSPYSAYASVSGPALPREHRNEGIVMSQAREAALRACADRVTKAHFSKRDNVSYFIYLGCMSEHGQVE